ncbi:MAG TPA: DUF1810 domain-containing protein [Sphingomicrobium sp.]|nr:DUF1810 domain-containing protein [Sphingomicrobium sp.]
MADLFDLQRFLDAQSGRFAIATAELRAGDKRSHWMWFVFPQLRELGRSPTAKFFGIVSIHEARAYAEHPILGARLRQVVESLLDWAGRRSPEQILGPVDAVKLRSSLTLFEAASDDALFATALDELFGGERDPLTLALLRGP